MCRVSIFPVLILGATGSWAQTSSLQVRALVTGTVSADQPVSYSIQAGENYFVLARVDQMSVDVAVRVLAPDGEELAAYAGRYFSAEIETFYDVEVIEQQLVLTQRRIGLVNLTADQQDRFRGMSTDGNTRVNIAFERDRNDQVIALYASNGRTRDVRFARLGEGSGW